MSYERFADGAGSSGQLRGHSTAAQGLGNRHTVVDWYASVPFPQCRLPASHLFILPSACLPACQLRLSAFGVVEHFQLQFLPPGLLGFHPRRFELVFLGCNGRFDGLAAPKLALLRRGLGLALRASCQPLPKPTRASPSRSSRPRRQVASSTLTERYDTVRIEATRLKL